MFIVNWRIALNANSTCAEDGSGCEVHVDFTGKRPGLVIFSAIVAVIVNWTSTIGIFLLTCESVVMRRTWILRVRPATSFSLRNYITDVAFL
jgi:hypothetical protein